jgi:WD40 repeat protein
MTFKDHVSTLRALAFSPDGKLLVSANQAGRVVLWDTARGIERHVLLEHAAGPVLSVAFSPDGRSVCVAEPAYRPADVVLYDPETGAVRKRLTGHPLGANAVAFSPDGQFMATIGPDHFLRLFDLATAREAGTLSERVGWAKSLAFSPDGTWLACAGGDEVVRLWDMRRRYQPAKARLALPSPQQKTA